MQRRQAVEAGDGGDGLVVDHRGLAEAAAAVHHPVRHGVHAGQPAEELPELGMVSAAVPLVQVERLSDLIGRAEHPELEAA
jgi:hypothetical protein